MEWAFGNTSSFSDDLVRPEVKETPKEFYFMPWCDKKKHTYPSLWTAVKIEKTYQIYTFFFQRFDNRKSRTVHMEQIEMKWALQHSYFLPGSGFGW